MSDDETQIYDMDEEQEEVDEEEEEEDEDEEEEESASLGPAALGLHRVGTKLPTRRSTPMQALNARGMPARLRKKNRFYEDDDEKKKKKPKFASPKGSPLKAATSAKRRQELVEEEEEFVPARPKKEKLDMSNVLNLDTMTEYDIQINSEQVGRRLKNLLKLPKAHKFVMYEWFYSNLDQVLFKGENDFQICMRETFPQLSARSLSRVEWTMIRRMMGKPRRCSQTFFDEERRELERKRQKIRLLQSRKMADVSFVKDLPRQIPLPFQLGTKVTARLRSPQDGLFTGVIAAIDSITHHYRVTFHRAGLGTHTVPDFELMSMEPVDTIPITNLTQNIRKKKLPTAYVASPLCAVSRMTDPVLGDSRHYADHDESLSALKEGMGVAAQGKDARITVAGHPFKMVEMMVRVRKLLAAKSGKLKKLKQMNSDVAINKSYDEPITEDDQRQYANIIISLERINRQVHLALQEIQVFSKYLAREPHIASLLQPSFLREKCRKMGEDSVVKHNEYAMTDSKILQLISDLATIMWVTSYMSNNDQFSHVLRVLEGVVEEAKNHLDPENVDVFNANVMVHVHHIKVGVSQMGQQDAGETIIEEVIDDVTTTLQCDDDVVVEDEQGSDTEYGVAHLVGM